MYTVSLTVLVAGAIETFDAESFSAAVAAGIGVTASRVVLSVRSGSVLVVVHVLAASWARAHQLKQAKVDDQPHKSGAPAWVV